MFLKKARAGSTSYRNAEGKTVTHDWASDGAVVEVDDAFGASLLNIPDAGFEQVADDDVPADAVRANDRNTDEADKPDADQPTGFGDRHAVGDATPIDESPAPADRKPAKATRADKR